MGIFDTIKNKIFARENNLTLEEVLLFNEMKKTEKMDVARFRVYLRAREAGIPLDDYEEYQKSYSDLGSVEEYKAYIDFKRKNPSVAIAFDEYLSYISRYESSFSPVEYQAFLLAKKQHLTEEQSTEYAKKYQEKYTIERYKDFMKAAAMGISLKQYDQNKKAQSLGLTVNELGNYEKCKMNPFFTESECLKYAREYSHLDLKRYEAVCSASRAGITISQYDEWEQNFSGKYTLIQYSRYLKAAAMNLTLDEYDELIAAQEHHLSVDDFRLYKQYQHSLTADEFRKCKGSLRSLKNNGSFFITDLSQVKIANKLGVGKVVLDAAIKVIPAYCFSSCQSFREIILPWRINSIGVGAFQNCSRLREISIPGSVTNIPGGIFNDCNSLERIELHDGIKTVNITGWVNLPSLKSVASACSIYDFKIDETAGYYKYVFLEDVPDSDKGKIKTLHLQARRMLSADFSMIEHYYCIKDYPQLETLILDCVVSSIDVQNCPNLKVIIIKEVDNKWHEYYKNGNIKKTHNEGENSLSITKGCVNNGGIRFFIVPFSLKKITTYNSNEMPKLSWLHVPSSCESIDDLKARNLKTIGATMRTKLPDSVERVILSDWYRWGKGTENPGFVYLDIGKCTYTTETYHQGKEQTKNICGLDKAIEQSSIKSIEGTLKILEGTPSIPSQYMSNTSIEKLVLPYSLLTICQQAFKQCEKLKAVSFSKVPHTISTSAFESCNPIEVSCEDTSRPAKELYRVRSFDLPPLEEIRISERIVFENGYAGQRIKNVVIERSVEKIGSAAFDHCSTLESVSIHGNPEIAGDAFKECKSVSMLKWDTTEPHRIAGKTGFPKIKEIKIHPSATIIREGAFESWGIEELIIPANIQSIESYAFANCKKLKKVSIEGNTVIAKNAFEGCLNIVSFEIKHHNGKINPIAGKTGLPKVSNIVIPEGTQVLDTDCFAKWGLKTIVIPSSVKEIRAAAFAANPLESIVIQGNPRVNKNAFKNCIEVRNIEWRPSSYTCIAGEEGFPLVEHFTIDPSVTSLEENAFCGWGLKEIDIPPSVKSIGNGAFKHCRNLETVKTGPDVQIGQLAFYGCASLTQINDYEPHTLPLEWIEKGAADAFKACTGFKTVKITANEELEKYIELIESCEIETVFIPPMLTYKAYASLLKVKSIQEILPSGTDEELPAARTLKKMPACSKNLKQLFVPQCINQITDKSFNECTKLTSLYLSPSVIVFDYHSFTGCSKLKKIVCHKNQKELIPADELPKGCKIETYGNADALHSVETIGINAELPKETSILSRQMITKIVIPDGTAFIPEKAFSGMKNLREVEIKAPIERIEANAFYDCDRLKVITLPDSVSEIGEMAFAGCRSLETIEIPQGVKRLSKGIFKGCSSLANVRGMDNVGYVEEDAFSDCSALKQIVFSTEIFSVKNAFVNCTSLEMLAIPVDIAEFTADISSCVSLMLMYLPQNIDSFKCVTAQNNHITVIANRGSSWKSALSVENVTYYKKADMEDKLEQLLEEAGYGVRHLDEAGLQEIHRDKSTGSVSPVKKAGASKAKKPAGRAEWSTTQEKNEDAVFTGGPADVDEMIKSLTNNNTNEYYTQREVDNFSNVNLDSAETVDGEEKRITSNIFSVELDAERISAKQYVISLVDAHGNVNSDQIEVSISNRTKVKQIKIQLQLKAGVPNGRYYIVVSDSKGEKNFYSEPIRIDIAFAMDDEFAF